MSYFDEPKNAGLLLLIIGVIAVICGVISMFMVVDGTNVSFSTDIKLAGIMSLIGALICGIIYIVLGMDVRAGAAKVQIGNFFTDLSSKYGLLTAFLAVEGIGGIISAICTMIGSGVGGGILSLIIAIIILIFAYLMSVGNAGKVIWIILAIIFVLGIILGIFSIIAIVGIPILLLYIMLFCFLVSPEVKEKMGM